MSALRFAALGVLGVLPLLGQGGRRPVAIGSDKQLFIDDLLVASRRNVELVMNPPQKTGEHTIVPEHPWEDFWAGGWNTIIEDEGIYKMWYDAASTEGAEKYWERDPGRFVCYAISRDAIRWEKPKLGLVDFRGSTANNIVLTETTGSVFLDPKRADGNRFKYTGWWNGERALPGYEKRTGELANLWIFTSPDGLRWKRLMDEPIMRGHFDTQNQIFWDDRSARWVAYVRLWEPLRKVGRSETADLRSWPKPQVVFGYDGRDPVESDHYNACAMKYPFASNVYLMFPSAYFHYKGKSNDGPLDIQMATSRDGIHWNRLDRRPYVRLGPKGSFDGGSVYMSLGMLRRGDEIWMYYTGLDITHGDYDMRTTRNKATVSRLVQRLDGFISADAVWDGGELTTVPLVFAGRKLVLNVDTSAMGSARVELQDEQGQPLPGFSAADCDPIDGNFTARTVTWKGKAQVAAAEGKPVRLRFALRAAKLYAFQFLP